MNSTPGRLTGSGVRRLPEHMIDGILRRLKVQQGRNFRIVSARYRVSGFRDPDSGEWVSRDPKNGHYYKVHGRARAGSARRAAGQAARHRTEVRPTPALLQRSDMLALEVEIDRGQGPRIFYVSLPK